MNILISNDDGYQAPGICALAEALEPHATVTVVAPDRDRSGASRSLTLDRPLRVFNAVNGFRYINGTPTDCVHVAITALLDTPPDLVMSGINSHANLGDDVFYSGTVAAAMEGAFMGVPAVAMSLANDGSGHFETAARVAVDVLARVRKAPMEAGTVLNVNVPDVRYDQLAGYEVARLGNRHMAEPVVPQRDPRGNRVYWVGPPGAEADAGPGTDFDAIRRAYVSVTPVSVDLTRHSAMAACEALLAT